MIVIIRIIIIIIINALTSCESHNHLNYEKAVE